MKHLCRHAGGSPFALGRLGHQAHADGLGADLDPHDAAIDDRANLLDIRPELAVGDAGDFGADAAQVFGFAAMGHLAAEFRASSQ